MNAQTQDYFAVLQLPAACEVDKAALERNYRELQSQWHPDRFAGAGQQEKLAAVQKTSLINDAYSTLKSPVSRAAHLLRLNNVDVDSHSQSHMDPAFLHTQMELRDQLETLVQTGDIDGLEAMQQETAGQKDALWEEFCRAMEGGDFETARKVFYKMQFMFKLRDEIHAAEEKLLGY